MATAGLLLGACAHGQGTKHAVKAPAPAGPADPVTRLLAEADTTISFYLPVRSRIALRIYDMLGREVRTLLSGEEREKGAGVAVWDGRDNAGRSVASGSYFYTLRFGNFEKTNKMMLVK